MSRFVFLLMAGAMTLVTGCKKHSNNPIVPETPPQANVNFTMHMESGTQGMIFVARSSVDVKLTKVVVSYPAENFTDTVVNPNPEQVITRDANIPIGEYTGIATHQQWVLVFHGTIAATGQAFTITVNWDVV